MNLNILKVGGVAMLLSVSPAMATDDCDFAFAKREMAARDLGTAMASRNPFLDPDFGKKGCEFAKEDLRLQRALSEAIKRVRKICPPDRHRIKCDGDCWDKTMIPDYVKAVKKECGENP